AETQHPAVAFGGYVDRDDALRLRQFRVLPRRFQRRHGSAYGPTRRGGVWLSFARSLGPDDDFRRDHDFRVWFAQRQSARGASIAIRDGSRRFGAALSQSIALTLAHARLGHRDSRRLVDSVGGRRGPAEAVSCSHVRSWLVYTRPQSQTRRQLF